MDVRSLGLAVAAGSAGFLLVGVGVTEFARPWIAFTLFLGIPAGFAAGGGITAAVYLGLADEAPPQRRRIAGAFAAFGVVFLTALLGVGGLLNVGATLSLGTAFLVGFLTGTGVYLRGTRAADTSDFE